jgi:polyisoprenyl-teichoic acid--peptidoglycan teichoic acid transferase
MSEGQAPRPHRETGGGVAAITSSIVPGWGHSLLGRGRVGRALLFIDGLLLIAALVAVLFFQIELLKAWVTPTALLTIIGLNLVVLTYRGAATVDAFNSASRHQGRDWVGLGVAVIVVIAPHLLVGGLALTQYDLIQTVFAPNDPVASPTSTTSTTSLAITPTTTAAGSTTTTTAPATTTTAEPRIWDGKERLNVMLLGSDAGEGRIGTRTDTIILVSIEPETGNVAMFSIPRNLSEAPLPEGMGLWSCGCFPDIITHLWANGEWYPDAFPGPQEPSINALKGALGLIFDMDIHYYAKVDLKGFVGVVDALGGVDIDIPARIVDEEYPHEDGGTESLVFEPGPQHLDGHHALAYARIRRHSGDFARMHRQRCVLGALVAQVGPLDVLRGFGQLATAVKENVVTDIPTDRLGDFVELIPKIDTSKVVSLRITRYNYGFGNTPGHQLYDLDQIRADAKILMANPNAVLDTLDGYGLDASCDESFD